MQGGKAEERSVRESNGLNFYLCGHVVNFKEVDYEEPNFL